MASTFVSLLMLALVASAAGAAEVVVLKNAAQPGQTMPAMGLGTFGYGQPNGNDGEHWNNSNVQEPVKEWIKMGGVRIDGAVTYMTQWGLGDAITAAGAERKDLFLTSKIPIGRTNASMPQYNKTIGNFEVILQQLQTDYVDLLLIHWPGTIGGKPGPGAATPCAEGGTSYKTCRQEAWRALVDLFKAGKAKAIGVSNFEQHHIEDLVEMKTEVPAVNQVEFHAYWHEDDLVKYCLSKDIHFQSYSPLGAPDHMAFHKDKWPLLPAQQPGVVAIAKRLGVTAEQVLLSYAWTKYGISANPRTRDPAHMKDNLAALGSVTLEAADIAVVDNLLQQKGAPTTACNPLIKFECNNKVCPDPSAIP